MVGRLLWLSGACGGVLGVLALAALDWSPIRRIDRLALEGSAILDRAPLSGLTDQLLHVLGPGVFAVLCAGAVLTGLRLVGLSRALASGVLLAGANITAQALKLAFAEPRAYTVFGEDGSTWRLFRAGIPLPPCP